MDCCHNNVLLASVERRGSLAISTGYLSGCTGVGVKGRWGSASQSSESGQGEVDICNSPDTILI